MSSMSVRERLNGIIVRLERFKRLPLSKRKAGLGELKDCVDRELRECSAGMAELSDAEFRSVLSRIIALLYDVGMVVLVTFGPLFDVGQR
jgi:hypothetical protein